MLETLSISAASLSIKALFAASAVVARSISVLRAV
jgi:hypothetical protein